VGQHDPYRHLVPFYSPLSPATIERSSAGTKDWNYDNGTTIMVPILL